MGDDLIERMCLKLMGSWLSISTWWMITGVVSSLMLISICITLVLALIALIKG